MYSKLYGALWCTNMAANYQVSQKPTVTKNIDQKSIDKCTYSLTFSWFPLEGGKNEIMH